MNLNTVNGVSGDIDLIESDLYEFDPYLLRVLLKDKTTKQNILWATTDYSDCGEGYEEFSPILPEQIIGKYRKLIQPRVAKTAEEQAERTRNKAEVFTPSWVCNSQNNLIDEQWFGRRDVFNIEDGTTWTPTSEPVFFPDGRKNWMKYVDAKRLEITCGEAPYLVSRYDPVTGEKLPLERRIGLFDRKMRVVNENTSDAEDWLKWSKRALQSVYGYEYQGDNLLLARENVLLSYVDYYAARFGELPEKKHLRKLANIIAWNLWQMDGMKYVIPGSCVETKDESDQMGIDNFFVSEPLSKPCRGCATGDIHAHTGIYCKIFDWRENDNLLFISMMKGAKK